MAGFHDPAISASIVRSIDDESITRSSERAILSSIDRTIVEDHLVIVGSDVMLSITSLRSIERAIAILLMAIALSKNCRLLERGLH